MKYAVVLLNAIGVIILGWAMTALTRTVAPMPPSTGKAAQSVPAGNTELDAVQRSLAAIARLGRNMEQPAEAPSSSLIGQPLTKGEAGEGGPELPRRQLTVLLESAQGRSAVIDGQLVRKGDRLPEGGRVLNLRPNGVLLAEKQGRQALEIPAGKVRIGTVSSPVNDGTAPTERALADAGKVQAEPAAPDLGAAVAAALSAIQKKP